MALWRVLDITSGTVKKWWGVGGALWFAILTPYTKQIRHRIGALFVLVGINGLCGFPQVGALRKPSLRSGELWFAAAICTTKKDRCLNLSFFVVGTNGLEPSTSCMSSKRSNQLSYAPKRFLKFSNVRDACLTVKPLARRKEQAPRSVTANTCICVCSPRRAKQWVSTVLRTHGSSL